MKTIIHKHRILFLGGMVVLLSTVASLTYAQSKNDKVESMKIAFLSQKLSFSPEEARVFWPVYNQYTSEIETLRDAKKKARKATKEDFATMNDTEVEKSIDAEMGFRQSELDIQKKYHVQFKKVLPIKKVAMLYRAEEEFKKELIKKLQEQK